MLRRLIVVGVISVPLVLLALKLSRDNPWTMTRYIEQYDEGRFRAVNIGDSRGYVHELLGDPLSTESMPDGHDILQYSQPKDIETHMVKRYVVLLDERVVEVVADVDWDYWSLWFSGD